MAGVPSAAQGVIPFAGAALPYREKFFTKGSWTPGTSTTDCSPNGNAIKSYGYARALRIYTTNTTAGSGGNTSADFPWDLYSQISVTQPNGEELYGGPTWTGLHAYVAAQNSGWKLNNDPATWQTYSAAGTGPTLDLPIPFEINPQYGLGALPNQDFSAPWKLQLTGNTSAGIWTTAPTTTPVMTTAIFLDAWTVPAATNPLTGQQQQTAPVFLGTLSKWTLQTYTVPASTQFEVPFSRRGNAYRHLVFIILNSSGARIATTNFPNPITLTWDGTVIRSNDDVALWLDDSYQLRGGAAAATPVTNLTGVVPLSMSAVSGADWQGSANSLGEESFWGTVQSSTVSLNGTWGSTAATLQQLTNDVQLVDLTGNPYQFNAGVYLQAPAQPSVRP